MGLKWACNNERAASHPRRVRAPPKIDGVVAFPIRATSPPAQQPILIGGEALLRFRYALGVVSGGKLTTQSGMITVGVIRNGGTYQSQHLRKNDYWGEGEKQVSGEWIGQGATKLGLVGVVTDAPFEALRANLDWQTGKRLTARANKKARMALFDIQISAPKNVSILAMVGGDERVGDAFVDSVRAVRISAASLPRNFWNAGGFRCAS
jgi:hypothetical protein